MFRSVAAAALPLLLAMSASGQSITFPLSGAHQVPPSGSPASGGCLITLEADVLTVAAACC